ncbi:putative quinol monooxygenase [Malaciobacter sp. WC5094]
MEQVVVIANLKIKEQFLDEVYEELLALHNNTKKFDNGCLQYDLHKNLEEKNSFVFVETWASMDVLNEHTKKEHFVSFVQNVENKLESLEINKLSKVNI